MEKVKKWKDELKKDNMILIARYTANACGVVPIFNEGYQYTVNETVSNGVYTVELYSDIDFTSCSFYKKTNLLTVEYLKVTDKVTTLASDNSGLFDGCTSLTTVNVFDWDTSSVTDMSYMFRDCNKLTSLVLGNGFNMDNVTNIAYIFSGCNNLILLIVPNATVSMKLDDHLPTRTADSPGTLIVTGDKYNLDTNTPASKFWNITDKLR